MVLRHIKPREVRSPGNQKPRLDVMSGRDIAKVEPAIVGGLTVFSRPGRTAVRAGLGHLDGLRAGAVQFAVGARSWRQPVHETAVEVSAERSEIARPYAIDGRPADRRGRV